MEGSSVFLQYLTCRKRRVKCDETHPRCKNCERVERECFYPDRPGISVRTRTLSARTSSNLPSYNSRTQHSCTPSRPSSNGTGAFELAGVSTNDLGADIVDPTQSWMPFPIEQPRVPNDIIPDDGLLLDDSLFNFSDTLTPNLGPLEWFDLLAEDAINSMQTQTQNSRWNFDITSLSRRQSPRQSVLPGGGGAPLGDADTATVPLQDIIVKPWNTEYRIELKPEELVYFEHFITGVAPILDLFDPGKHFASVVPHLALRNVGLLKSLLAVGACHMAIIQPQNNNEVISPLPLGTPASTWSAPATTSRIAEQYYYETLQYISQNLLYQAYTTSNEILATAIMISTYEMYGTAGSSDHSNWDRHLRGAFWIQRTMDSNGESSDGLHRAIWWAWLRQDIWAAFRTGRPTLTIHQPKIPIPELTSDGLATRIIYIAAKCIQFAAAPKEGDIAGYMEAGETLMRMLDTWKRTVPQSFEPIPMASLPTSPNSTMEIPHITPIWIHPPAYAAAIQTYHFARIVMILNQPSTGGLGTYQTRFKLLRGSTVVICGIAIAQQSQNQASAFVSFQAVYAAALCAETQDRQNEVLGILDKVLNITKFPSKSILDDVVKVWNGT